jgi:hypothetical protein
MDLTDSLLRTHTYAVGGTPTAYLEPLYPAALAAARLLTIDSARLTLVLQILVASTGGLALDALGRRLGGPRVGMTAALAYAGYPYLVRESIAYAPNNLLIPLMLLAALLLTRARDRRTSIAAGLALGFVILTRATYGATLVAAVGWLAWRRGPRPAVAVLATALAVQGPWMIRGVRLDGSPLPTRVGENLLVSTTRYSGMIPEYDPDLLIPHIYSVGGSVLPPSLRESQSAVDRAMLGEALRAIERHPGRIAAWKIRNVAYLFDPRLLPRFPTAQDDSPPIEVNGLQVPGIRARPAVFELLHAVVHGTLLLFAIGALWRRGVRPDEEPLLIIAATQAIVCVVFFPTTRLLAPIAAVLMVYSALGLQEMLLHSRGRLAAWPFRPIPA